MLKQTFHLILHLTSKFIPTSVRHIFKQLNYDGLCHTMSCVIYIIQTGS